MPGVQKPHCRPCSCLNPSWIGCSSLALARPSTVVTSRPSTCTASIVQDLIAWPSTSTVQAPHDLRDLLLPVDREPDLADRDLFRCLVAEVVVHHRHGQAALSALATVPPRMRLTKTRTRCRLYSAVPAASATVSAVSGLPVSAAAASVAPMVEPPTPVSAMPALITVSPSVSIATAVPTVAKSPTRRSSFR